MLSLGLAGLWALKSPWPDVSLQDHSDVLSEEARNTNPRPALQRLRCFDSSVVRAMWLWLSKPFWDPILGVFGAPPILGFILVVGLGCSLRVRFGF